MNSGWITAVCSPDNMPEPVKPEKAMQKLI